MTRMRQGRIYAEYMKKTCIASEEQFTRTHPRISNAWQRFCEPRAMRHYYRNVHSYRVQFKKPAVYQEQVRINVPIREFTLSHFCCCILT